MDAQIQFPNGTPMRDGVLRRLMEDYSPERTEVVVICRPQGVLNGCAAYVLPGSSYCARHQPGQPREQ